MKYTKKDARPILQALRNVGLKPSLIGSVAKSGHSDKDIDILLPLDLSSPLSLGGIRGSGPAYDKYQDVMSSLGFENTDNKIIVKDIDDPRQKFTTSDEVEP